MSSFIVVCQTLEVEQKEDNTMMVWTDEALLLF